MTDITTIAAPPEQFNFAQFLLERNAGHGERPAFIDDQGMLTYGDLSQRVRSMAAGLRSLGLKREERVLLLMHDCNDWPVSFLGAMYAGLVPVAVNTLLTPDDYAYMLEHSRAQAVLVSGALLPALTAAMIKSDHEVTKVIVSKPAAPLHPAEVELEAFLQGHQPLTKSAPTNADDPGFWLYSSGSTGRPKGTVHSHANPYWTSMLYGKDVLKITEHDVCFSAAKLFFAYGLGNGLTFPMTVGACAILMAERPTPDATFKRMTGGVGGVKPTIFFAHPQALLACWLTPTCPAKNKWPCAWCPLLAKPCPQNSESAFTNTSAFTSWMALAPLKCCTSSCPTNPTMCATAPRAGPCPATTLNCAAMMALLYPTANRATSTSKAPLRHSCTGATAKKAVRPSKAVGPKVATNTFAMPMAPTPMEAAQMTCSKSVAFMSAPSK
jgi:hypothetical protein